MAETGEELVKAIQRDLLCPQCEYNLRGLYGDTVSCPECVAVCDVAGTDDLAWAMQVLPDDKIVLAGHKDSPNDVALVLLDSDGSIETRFGTNGRYSHSATTRRHQPLASRLRWFGGLIFVLLDFFKGNP